MNKIETAMREVFRNFENEKNHNKTKSWCGCFEGDTNDDYKHTKENFIKKVMIKLKKKDNEE